MIFLLRLHPLKFLYARFTVYGKVGDVPESDDEMTTFAAIGVSMMGGNDDAQEYYAEFEHPEHGKCCLYFMPNAALREALEPFLSRALKKQRMNK